LKKLVKELDYNSDIYIHIDKKSNLDVFKSAINLDNVFFIKNRVSINWGDISMIDAQINLIDEVIKQSEKYTHAVFLSGSCFPIKKQKVIYENFSSFPQREFIKFIDMRESPEHYMKQIKFKWFKKPVFNSNNIYITVLDKLIRFLLNKLRLKNNWNNQIIPYFGSQWVALTMNCCKYVRDYHYASNGFREMNKYTFSPDEHYFHTIIGNSFFAKKSFGKMEFQGRGTWRLANYHIIDKSLSKWYILSDWTEIINSEKLFVRKINSQTGNDLVVKIRSELL
jgi:hypothetical protein